MRPGEPCNVIPGLIFNLRPPVTSQSIRGLQHFPDLVVDSASPYVSHSPFSPWNPRRSPPLASFPTLAERRRPPLPPCRRCSPPRTKPSMCASSWSFPNALVLLLSLASKPQPRARLNSSSGRRQSSSSLLLKPASAPTASTTRLVMSPRVRRAQPRLLSSPEMVGRGAPLRPA